jgi:hypothetical protein
MEISSIQINDNNTAIDLVIADAADVTSLKLWTDKTYKNFSKAIDLTSKLTGSVTENITISLSDIGAPFFVSSKFINIVNRGFIRIFCFNKINPVKEGGTNVT